MGKRLVIQGADFRESAIVREFYTLELMQSFYALTTGYVNESTYRFGSASLLKLNKGDVITFKGLDKNNLPLYVEWACYIENSATTSKFKTASHNTFVNNAEGRDEFSLVIPDSGYYGFSFANNPTKNTTPCLAAEYAPIKYVVE